MAHNNLYEAQMKFKGFLCYSKLIYVDFKLNKPRLMPLWPPLDGIHEQNWEKLMKIFTTVKKKHPLLFYETM